ncbi:hypothetical protein NBRC116493_24370 [Aurantivibrio infirmus]
MITKLKKKITKKYYKTVYKNRVVIDDYRDLHLLLAPENHVDRRLKAKQPYENEQIDFVLTQIRLKSVDWFIDVGANIGLYSLLVAKNSQQIKKVFAIEAQVENYNQLCGNIFLNKFDRIIHPINIGASDRKNKTTFLRNMGNSTGTSRIQETAPSTTKFHRFEEDSIVVDTLDSIISKQYAAEQDLGSDNSPKDVHNKNLFFKIDVEGHELNVLKGMRELLSNNHCILQIEILYEVEETSQQICENFGLEKIHQIGSDNYFETKVSA